MSTVLVTGDVAATLEASDLFGDIETVAVNVENFELVLNNPRVLIGIFIGGVIPFVIASITMTGSPFETVSLTYADFLPVANDVDALIDRMNIMFTAGTLDPATRAAIAGVLSDIDDPNIRMRVGLYLFLISPDYAARL